MIEIIKKPDRVSWDEISKVVYQAHAKNRAKGIDIRNAHLSGDEMRDSLGQDGECFVALNNETGNVIGCCCVCYKTINCWYATGKYPYVTLDAVLPEYSGIGVFSRLSEARERSIREKGVEGVYMCVAEGNKLRRIIAKKEGYYEVAIAHTSFNSHNYIILFKWFDKKPFSDIYIKTKYLVSYIKLKINLLLGHVK